MRRTVVMFNDLADDENSSSKTVIAICINEYSVNQLGDPLSIMTMGIVLELSHKRVSYFTETTKIATLQLLIMNNVPLHILDGPIIINYEGACPVTEPFY